MHLTHDQVWVLEDLTKQHGYNSGFKLKYERHWLLKTGRVVVHYIDENRTKWSMIIGPSGERLRKYPMGKVKVGING